MPQRETVGQIVLEEWKGCNQRLQPTLVPDGFFTWAKGVYFGLGDNAERLTGKTLSQKFDVPVLVIQQWGKFAILQLSDRVVLTTL